MSISNICIELFACLWYNKYVLSEREVGKWKKEDEQR